MILSHYLQTSEEIWLYIWRRVTRLAELLGKGEIPAAIDEVLFCRLTVYMGLADNSSRQDLGKKSRVARHAEIRFCWKRVCFASLVLQKKMAEVSDEPRGKKRKEEGKKAFQVVSWLNAFITNRMSYKL